MDKVDTACEHIKLRLIAAALGLQQCTKTDGTEVLIPGTDKRILIGGDAYLAKVAAPAVQPSEQPDEHTQFVAWARGEDYPTFTPNGTYFGGLWHARKGWLGALARQAVPEAPVSERCPHCDDTGDVHRADGEWMGQCSCGAAQAAPEEVRESAERWQFMMRIADDEEGPEFQAMAKVGQGNFDDARPKSVQLSEMVDAARATLRITSTDSEKGGAA